MTKDGILNPDLCDAIARCGHMDFFVIADAGLPLPEGVRVVDLSLVRGIPSFLDTLSAVLKQLVVESFVLADQMEQENRVCYDGAMKLLGDLPHRTFSHQQLKEVTKKATVIVRTGEATSYANVVLVCGVNF
ncbi:MAG: D-ribose pyranase [Oscillospiraceae bacterium]